MDTVQEVITALNNCLEKNEWRITVEPNGYSFYTRGGVVAVDHDPDHTSEYTSLARVIELAVSIIRSEAFEDGYSAGETAVSADDERKSMPYIPSYDYSFKGMFEDS